MPKKIEIQLEEEIEQFLSLKKSSQTQMSYRTAFKNFLQYYRGKPIPILFSIVSKGSSWRVETQPLTSCIDSSVFDNRDYEEIQVRFEYNNLDRMVKIKKEAIMGSQEFVLII